MAASDNEYPYTTQSVTGETPVPRWLRDMAVPAMTELDRFVNLVSTNWTWLPHPVFSRQRSSGVGMLPESARILRAPRIGKPRARWKRAVPGILANEWRPSNKFSFAVESGRIMETWWWMLICRAYHQVSMILPLSTANENGFHCGSFVKSV